jgi:hypothetical protein
MRSSTCFLGKFNVHQRWERESVDRVYLLAQALNDNKCQSGLQDKIVVVLRSANIKRPTKNVSECCAVAI